MKNISYNEFLTTVSQAEGAFSYIFDGTRFSCDPAIYIARNWSKGLPAKYRRTR